MQEKGRKRKWKEASCQPANAITFTPCHRRFNSYHPHGILSIGAFINFTTEANDTAGTFPGVNFRYDSYAFHFVLSDTTCPDVSDACSILNVDLDLRILVPADRLLTLKSNMMTPFHRYVCVLRHRSIFIWND